MGEERQIGDLSERRVRDGDVAIDAGFFARANNQRLAAEVARTYQLGGPALLGATACSSGNAAIAMAYDLISEGAVERMVVGGADTFHAPHLLRVSAHGALSASICRPFDRAVTASRSGRARELLVLESLEGARRRARAARGDRGYGISNDAHHFTAPGPMARASCARSTNARDQRLAREQIDYVSAHGTGTPYNDAGESEMMVKAFGARARQVPISSIKSMIGHTNGAASAIEAVACALAIEHDEVPPTANLEEPDPEFDLDYVPKVGRKHPVSTCLSLAAGFGGFNVCLALRRAP